MVSDSASRTAEIAPAPDRPRVRQPVRVRRELASWPTLVLVLVCVLVALPLTIMFTPDQRVTVAGQDVYVGARRPSFSLSGPSQLVQVGNTELDIAPLPRSTRALAATSGRTRSAASPARSWSGTCGRR
jgi:hypothetical protein